VKRLSRSCCLGQGAYVAMDPALGNQSDPADQDSRTSFPDKDDFGAFAPAHNSATARTVGSNPDAGAHANVLCSQCPRSKYRQLESARGRVRARGGPPVWFGPGRSKLVQASRLRPSQERTTADNADAFARGSVSLNTWEFYVPARPSSGPSPALAGRRDGHRRS
jgi:hypothetical protein